MIVIDVAIWVKGVLIVTDVAIWVKGVLIVTDVAITKRPDKYKALFRLSPFHCYQEN